MVPDIARQRYNLAYKVVITIRCPYCNQNFRLKADCVKHIEKRHPEALVDSGLNAEQVLYQSTHGTIHGKCMCGCGRDTEWNYKTGKPYKLSTNLECKKRIAAIADARNMRIYGKAKVIDDPEMQKKMLEARKITNLYTFKDGGKIKYTGKLEKNFLQFCDNILELESRMVLDNPEVFKYYDPKENRDRFYIPDYYLPDYNLIIEIKPGGEHPNMNPAYIEETKYKEALKDEAMAKQAKYNYLKIVDKQYGPLVETLFAIVHGTKPDNKHWNGSFRVLKESATNTEFLENFLQETFSDFYVVVATDNITGVPKCVGLSESNLFSRIYIGTNAKNLHETNLNNPIFENCELDIYRFIGKDEIANAAMNEAISSAETSGKLLNESIGVNLGALEVLENCGIVYNFGNGLSNSNYPMSQFVEADFGIEV